MRKVTKAARKLAVTIVGSAVIAAGVLLLVLPGPGLLVIAAGLFILSLEFEWAERLLQRAKKKLKETRRKVSRNKSN